MNIERVLAVYSGFSLDVWGQSGASYPATLMPSILDDALSELEYCMGSVDTTYGAMRAADGHPEPFPIHFVEIGNEDWFSQTYPYRFPIMYDGLKAAYPNITYISTAFDENAYYNISIPEGAMWDTHHYEEPSYFVDNFNFYDNWQVSTNNTDVGVLLGEFSVIQIDTPSGIVDYSFPADVHISYPRLISALAEGVYAIGAERNPNTVKMSSYAPSLQNRNWYNWTPDMISFDAGANNTVRSASYWQQHLFAHYRGTQTLPVTNSEGDFNPLFWVATIDEASNVVYVKVRYVDFLLMSSPANKVSQVINILSASVPLTINFDCAYSAVNGTIITASDINAYNYVSNQTQVVPQPLTLNSTLAGAKNGRFIWDVPKWSITVLQFDL